MFSILTWSTARLDDTSSSKYGASIAQSELSKLALSYNEIRDKLASKAKSIARDPRVTESLRSLAENSSSSDVYEARTQILEYFAELKEQANHSTELYLSNGTLLGWSGQSFGLESAIENNSSRIGDVFVQKGNNNEAFRYIEPILHGDEVIGRIITSRFIRIKRSENSGASSGYSLKNEWAQGSSLDIDLVLGPKENVRLAGEARFLPMERLDGSVLGYIAISPPDENFIVEARSNRWRQLLLFFSTLLGLYLILLFYWWLTERIGSKAPKSLIWSQINLWLAFICVRIYLQFLGIPSNWFKTNNSAMNSPFLKPSEEFFGAQFFESVGDLFLSSILILLFSVLSWNLTKIKSKQYSKVVISGVEKWKSLGLRSLGITVILLLFSQTVSTLIDSTGLDLVDWSGIVSEWGVMLVYTSLLSVTLATIILASLTAGIQGYIRELNLTEICLTVLLIFLLQISIQAVATKWSAGNYWIPFGLAIIGPLSAWYWQKRNLTRYRTLIVRTILLLIVLSSFIVYPFIYQNRIDSQRDLIRETASQYAEFKQNLFQRNLANSLSILHENADLSRRISKALESSSLLPEDVVFLESLIELPQKDNLSLVLLNNDKVVEYSEGPYADALSTGAIIENLFTYFEQTPASLYVRVVSLAENDTLGSSSNFDESLQLDAGITTITSGGENYAYIIIGAEKKQSLALSEYRAGRLTKSQSGFFEPQALDPEIEKTLSSEDEFWRREEIGGQSYQAYYRKFSGRDLGQRGNILDLNQSRIISVRSQASSPYDHLYFLLRIAVSGLLLGIPIYLIGLAFRFTTKETEYSSRQFGDKVLDYFVAVGIITVILGGLFGQRVISRENTGAIQSRLERRISRLEGAIEKQARDQNPAELIAKIDIDSLAEQLQLELNIYNGPELYYTTDPNSDLLNVVDKRLPIDAFKDIFTREFNVAFADVLTLTDTRYTMGYRAFRDSLGYPAKIVGILTIPEQKRIREERARTTAYVYGALLLLLVIIMATASVLSNAVSKPIRKLREGLNHVAQGRFESSIPVESKDELGDLVQTFNSMQELLAESRRKLARTEREAAWSEMARQVAHEIKNPLTPMKLSIQHLQRSMGNDDQLDSEQREMINNITRSLIEQIDDLARIANEFSSFGRMPIRNLESQDLNAIIRETASLYSEDKSVQLHLDLENKKLFTNCDREETKRIFLNLIKNAKQAVIDNGEISIQSRALHNENVIEVIVADKGSGIPEDLRSRIFEPNFSTKTSGMGLGLAIVHRSMEEIGGSIHFESSIDKQNHGTQFFLRFPLRNDSPEGS